MKSLSHLINLYMSLAAVGLGLLAPCRAAGGTDMENPDFTQGGVMPAGATHDWNLGATGARGWMHSAHLSTHLARQIAITSVDKGSPADGLLKVGDVILGVDGVAFSYDARVEFGKALTAAETEKGEGKLSLMRWRDGKTDQAVVQLQVLGSYSATAPYDCPKSARILDLGCKALAERITDPNYSKRTNAITRSLNALALLSSGDKACLPLVQKEAKWASEFSSNSFQPWWYGYVMTFLSEYVMATGDRSVMPGLERLAIEASKGQSIVGSWGHGFAKEDGRLGSYGMMNSPGVPLTISLVLARKAGVKNPAVDLAIDRSAKLIRFYDGKGSVPYGDHEPWMQAHDSNGKCGMAAVLFNLLDERGPTSFFSRMSLAGHGAERDTGHSSNFFNITWAIPSIANSGPQATGAWMQEFGGWYFDLARRWDYSYLHQGEPQAKPDTAGGWDATGAYLLAYSFSHKTLMLTGKGDNGDLYVDAATAKSIIEDGKGWTYYDKTSFYGSLSEEELLIRLDSWSPIVRQRAADGLAMKNNPPIDKLVEKLDSDRLESRLGACQALTVLKDKSAPALPVLIKLMEAKELWLRVSAADAIASMGSAGMSAAPVLLERMAKNGPSEQDPRGMEQRFLSFSIFNKMLKTGSLTGIDRELLRHAIAAGLQNQDGNSRKATSGIYNKLTLEEITPLLPAIYEAIVVPSPSGVMFADGVRTAGLQLLGKHKIMKGLPLCLDLMEINRWGKKDRIIGCIKALEAYGDTAKPMLPRITQMQTDLKAHKEAKLLKPSIDRLDKLIRRLEKP